MCGWLSRVAAAVVSGAIDVFAHRLADGAVGVIVGNLWGLFAASQSGSNRHSPCSRFRLTLSFGSQIRLGYGETERVWCRAD